MKQLMPFIVVIIFFALVAIFILALYNYRLKRRIIESGPLDDTGLKFLAELSSGSEALKWGIILLFAGLGLVIMEFVPFTAESSPLPYGLEIVFIGAGFLVYYLLLQKNSSKGKS